MSTFSEIAPAPEAPDSTFVSVSAEQSENQSVGVNKWHIDANVARETFRNALLAVVGYRCSGKSIILLKLADLCDATLCPLEEVCQASDDVDDGNRLRFFVTKSPFDTTMRNNVTNDLVVIEAAWWNDIRPEIRREIDYVVLTGRQDKKTVERIWQQYEHLFPATMNHRLFAKAIDECTRDWRRVVIDVSQETRQGVRTAKLFWLDGVV